MNILLTGYTGNLGPSIAAALGGHRIIVPVRNPAAAPHLPNVTVVAGDLQHLPEFFTGEVEMIVHGAAQTGFTLPLEELRAVNVAGTQSVLDYARRCRRLKRFVHVSTCFVCGAASGNIPETPLERPARFINGYEESKWEAERAVLQSGLPHQSVRLSIVAGSAVDGHVRRPGALHSTLLWVYRGLIPMMPGTADSPVDIISLEFAAACVAKAVNNAQVPSPVVHAALGDRAPRLGELLKHLEALFREEHRGWQSGNVSLPDIVDGETFRLFEQSAKQSGDVLFQRICQDAQTFLPGLLHPRVYAAANTPAEAACDWRELTTRVFRYLKINHWSKPVRAAA
ncbi:MAG TPA: SDR family oxidoreductase [Verrucomicrobiales bacterium]|nr:SDR family oxidoreductase [Verrucomicrobiales bacterium]